MKKSWVKEAEFPFDFFKVNCIFEEKFRIKQETKEENESM